MLPTQVHRHIKQFVHTGNLNDIEQTILAIHNLISRNKKFVLEFDTLEDLRFSFRPKLVDLGNMIANNAKIEFEFDPEDPQSTTIISRAYPFMDQTDEEIVEQKKWIVFFLYDLLQQFSVDLEFSSNEKIIADSNANLTRNALTRLFQPRRNKENTPRWYKEMKKLLPLIRAGIQS